MADISIETTTIFRQWLHELKDPLGKAGIASRLTRAEQGNFGDHKLLPDSGGIYEMRIFKGNGYRNILHTQGRYDLLAFDGW